MRSKKQNGIKPPKGYRLMPVNWTGKINRSTDLVYIDDTDWEPSSNEFASEELRYARRITKPKPTPRKQLTAEQCWRWLGNRVFRLESTGWKYKNAFSFGVKAKSGWVNHNGSTPLAAVRKAMKGEAKL